MSIEKIKPFIVDASQNFTFNGVTVTGNILSDNAHLGNYVEANYISGTLVTGSQPNITVIGTLANLSVTDTVIAGTIKTDNLLHANGDVWSTGGGGTASASGSNTQVQFNDAGVFGATTNFTFNKITNTLTVTNYVGNGAALTNLNGSNVTGQVANALVAGTVYTNAQPNITSVGTLASLDVIGNISSGNANLGNLVIANYFSGAGNNLSNIQGANVSGAVAFATTANAVAGANVSGQVNYAATANSVAAANVFGQVANALVAGTVYTNAQPNITSVGTLASLDVTGNVTAAFFIGNGSQLTGLPASYANANVASYLPTYTGNLSPANLTVSASANLGAVGNVKITGGANGQYLQTDGAGNLTWANKFYVGNIPPTSPTYGDVWYYVDDTLSPPMAKLYMWVTDGGSDYFYDFLPPTF